MARDGTKSGGGSRKGIPNKATADLRGLAQEYTAAAILRLATLAGLVGDGAGRAESEQVQAYCCDKLIDRGHGRAAQSVDVTVRRPSELSDAELATAAADAENALAAFRGLPGPVPGGAGSTQH